MSMDGQGTKRRRNIAKNFNRLSRVHECYRRQSDGRATAYIEREREFTFAKTDRNDNTNANPNKYVDVANVAGLHLLSTDAVRAAG